MNRHQHQRLTALIEALEADPDALSWSEERLLGELQEIRRAQAGDTVQSYVNETYGKRTPASASYDDAVQSEQDAIGHYIKATYGR